MSGTSIRKTPSNPGELLRTYATTHQPADLDELAQHFGPLARRLAWRHGRGNRQLEDVEQVANVGLIKALQRYEPGRGFTFSTFAVPTIVGEIKRFFRDTGWAVHVPRSLQERSARVRAVSTRLSQDCGHAPTTAAIALALGESQEDVLEALAASATQASLDAPVGDPDMGLTLADELGEPDPGYEEVVDRWAIDDALTVLTDKERAVVDLRFRADLPHSAIAARLGLSPTQISRILRTSMRRAAARATPPSARSCATNRTPSLTE